MKPDLSEFSYGFALTSELIQSCHLQSLGAPIFPSLKAEGKAGGGYDVQLPFIPVFLQFKLSDYLTTRKALDFTRFGGPYYRFKLRALSYSKQHELLLELEKKWSSVYYSAPRFHTSSELNKAFAMGQVRKQSVFVRPSSIGVLPDESEHTVSFTDSGMIGILRSEPVEIELHDDEVFESVGTMNSISGGSQAYGALGDQLLEIYLGIASPNSDNDLYALKEQAQNLSPQEYVRIIAMSLFDCELLVRHAG
jgi:hypothetical protein